MKTITILLAGSLAAVACAQNPASAPNESEAPSTTPEGSRLQVPTTTTSNGSTTTVQSASAPTRPTADAMMRSNEVATAQPPAREAADPERAEDNPLDQGQTKGDLEISHAIRHAIVANETLSFTAKSIKIVTVHGNVTLRGPVLTSQERAAIEAIARKAPGSQQVSNLLEVSR